MRVLDPDACLGTRSLWLQEAGKPGLHEESPPMAEPLLAERQEFRVVSRLPPFPQAAARLALFLQDVQVLLQEDLHDLQEPLLACQAHAQTDEQHAVLDLITSEVADLDEMLYQRMELLKGHWQRGMAVISDDWSQVREQEIAVPG
jgi:hypothetical protein